MNAVLERFSHDSKHCNQKNLMMPFIISAKKITAKILMTDHFYDHLKLTTQQFNRKILTFT